MIAKKRGVWEINERGWNVFKISINGRGARINEGGIYLRINGAVGLSFGK